MTLGQQPHICLKNSTTHTGEQLLKLHVTELQVQLQLQQIIKQLENTLSRFLIWIS